MPRHSASAVSAQNRWNKGPCATRAHHARRPQRWHLLQHCKGLLQLICNGSFPETTSIFPQMPLHNASWKPEPNLSQCQEASCKPPQNHSVPGFPHVHSADSILIGECWFLFARETLGWHRGSNTLSVAGSQTWILLQKRYLASQVSDDWRGPVANSQRFISYFKTNILTVQEGYIQLQKHTKNVWNDQVCNLTCSWCRNKFCLLPREEEKKKGIFYRAQLSHMPGNGNSIPFLVILLLLKDILVTERLLETREFASSPQAYSHPVILVLHTLQRVSFSVTVRNFSQD